MNGNPQLDERLRQLSWPVDHGGVWASIEARAYEEERRSQEPWDSANRAGEQADLRKRSVASRRGSALRVALFASIAVVLVAGAAIGGLMAVRNLARPAFVLAITDETNIAAGGSTTPSGNWERLPLTGTGVPVDDLALDPSNPSTLYARTGAGLFKSSDGAGSWDQTLDFSAIAGQVFLVAFDPAAPSTVYTIVELRGDDLPRLLRSDDGGVTWADLNVGGTFRVGGYLTGFWFDTRTTPSTVYTWGLDTPPRSDWHVYRSTDRGGTWTTLSLEEAGQATTIKPGLPAAPEQALDAFLASFDGTVTDADTGVVVSVIPANKGIPGGTRADSVVVDPDQPSTFYAPTTDGVYKSTDGGRSWRKASAGLGGPAVSSVLADPSSPLALYASTTAGVFRSRDGGKDWTLIQEGEGCVGLAPSNPSRLYAWTTTGLFRSDDGGQKWAALEGIGLSGPTASALLSVAADNPDLVFAMPTMAASLAGSEGGLSRSIDGGNTWSEVLEGATLLVTDPKTPSTLFAAASSKVLKSADTGGTWTVVSPKQWVDAVVDIAIDPYAPSDVYAVRCSDTGAYSVSRSVDGGATWQEVGLEGPAKYIQQLLFDPRSPGTLYVLTFQVVESVVKAGIYRSTDGGATWENIIGGLPSEGYINIVIDPASSGGLYATAIGGLFKWVPNSK